jgi:phosphoribosylanthranilate isomerase
MTVQRPNSFRTGPDERGHFGIYGGRFVAETLMPLILDLEKAYAGTAALILYDAKAPEALTHALPGGNGIAFDWSLIGPGRAAPSFILSGGLNAGNVASAIRVTGASIVDVSSGVEKSPGIKDITLIREFIAAAKGAHSITRQIARKPGPTFRSDAVDKPHEHDRAQFLSHRPR